MYIIYMITESFFTTMNRELLLLLQDQNLSVPAFLEKSRSTNANEVNSSRSINGEYATLFPVIRTFPYKFKEYMRMEVTTFDYLPSKIEPLLEKNWCNLHVQPIYSEERLVLTLR